MSTRKISVAQIRGDGLSDRETKIWKYFPDDIRQTVFVPKHNLFVKPDISFPIVSIRSSSDNFFSKNFYKYFFGQYRKMFGLEKKLTTYDVVHAGEIFNYYTYQSVLAKKINKKLKVVATVWENSFGRFDYNYWPGFKSPPNFWLRQIRHVMAENAKGVDMFLPTTGDAAELLSYYGVAEHKIKIVTPGIVPPPQDLPRVLPDSLLNKELFLMVNRLVKEKGVYDVLYGWKIYLSKTVTVEKKILVVIGQGPELQNMKKIAKDIQIENQVVFLNHLPYNQVLIIFKEAKCLILGSIPNPTWQEQFGYVLAESICAGTPVISTFSGAIPEVVGKAGLLVSPAHPIELSKALLQMDNVDVYKNLKKACDTEAERFSTQLYVQKVSDVYRQLTVI